MCTVRASLNCRTRCAILVYGIEARGLMDGKSLAVEHDRLVDLQQLLLAKVVLDLDPEVRY